MRQPIKLIIRKIKISKNGLHTIFLQYCHTTAKRVIISTGISIPAMYWDKSNCTILASLPGQYGSAPILQDKLEKQKAKAERIIIYVIKKKHWLPFTVFKKKFSPLRNAYNKRFGKSVADGRMPSSN